MADSDGRGDKHYALDFAPMMALPRLFAIPPGVRPGDFVGSRLFAKE